LAQNLELIEGNDVSIMTSSKFVDYYSNLTTLLYDDYIGDQLDIDAIVTKSGIETLHNCLATCLAIRGSENFKAVDELAATFDYIFCDAVLLPLALSFNTSAKIISYQTSIGIPPTIKKDIVLNYATNKIFPPIVKLAIQDLWFRRRNNKILREFTTKYGVDLSNHQLTHPVADANIIFTSAYFQPFSHKLTDSYLVGPLLADSEKPVKISVKRRAYVSLGTMNASDSNNLRPIVSALLSRQYTVFVKIPEGFSADWIGSPNVISQTFFDQVVELETCSLFITHAGKNSADEAILTKTPVICVPQANDQFLIAARLEELGLGLISDLNIKQKSFTKTLDLFEKSRNKFVNNLELAYNEHITSKTNQVELDRMIKELGLGSVTSTKKD